MQAHRLPPRSFLERLSPAEARSILDGVERELREHYPDDRGVAYDHRGRAYYRGLVARRLKRIAELRVALFSEGEAA
jgi:hypothetical protein